MTTTTATADIDRGQAAIDASGDRSGQQRPLRRVVLSVDELRALCRSTDLVLPVKVTEGDEHVEAVDRVALRGLAARDLIDLTGNATGFVVRGDLSGALAPCHDARVVAEVDHDEGGDLTSWSVIGSDLAPSTVVAERSPGVVIVALEPADVAHIVVARCQATEVAVQSAGAGFTVPAATHQSANDAIDDGEQESAIDVLVGAGAAPDAATAFVHAVRHRRGAVAVKVARKVGVGDDGPFEAGEVRWIVGPAGETWRLTIELADEPTDATDDDESDDEVLEARLVVTVAPIARHHLIEALRTALAPSPGPGQQPSPGSGDGRPRIDDDAETAMTTLDDAVTASDLSGER